MGANFMNSYRVTSFMALKAFKGKGENRVFRRIGAVVLGLAGALGASGAWAVNELMIPKDGFSVEVALAPERPGQRLTVNKGIAYNGFIGFELKAKFPEDVGKQVTLIPAVWIPEAAFFGSGLDFYRDKDGWFERLLFNPFDGSVFGGVGRFESFVLNPMQVFYVRTDLPFSEIEAFSMWVVLAYKIGDAPFAGLDLLKAP